MGVFESKIYKIRKIFIYFIFYVKYEMFRQINNDFWLRREHWFANRELFGLKPILRAKAHAFRAKHSTQTK